LCVAMPSISLVVTFQLPCEAKELVHGCFADAYMDLEQYWL